MSGTIYVQWIVGLSAYRLHEPSWQVMVFWSPDLQPTSATFCGLGPSSSLVVHRPWRWQLVWLSSQVIEGPSLHPKARALNRRCDSPWRFATTVARSWEPKGNVSASSPCHPLSISVCWPQAPCFIHSFGVKKTCPCAPHPANGVQGLRLSYAGTPCG